MKIRTLLSALAAILLFVSCDSETDFPENDIQLYQQYEVFVQNESLAGFANFRVGSDTGERFRLTGDASVKVNDRKMLYSPSISETNPEFNYATFIDLSERTATFSFHRAKGRTLKNVIDYSDISSVTGPEGLKQINLGERYPFSLSGTLGNNDVVRVTIMPSVVTDNPVTYTADVNYMSNTFTFTDAAPGRYIIRYDVVRSRPTQENDGNAGGIIRVIRRTATYEVAVAQ